MKLNNLFPSVVIFNLSILSINFATNNLLIDLKSVMELRSSFVFIFEVYNIYTTNIFIELLKGSFRFLY